MDWVAELCSGVASIHDDVARAAFLERTWSNRASLRAWAESDPFVRKKFKTSSLPTFLHGGSSSGKIVVMGINPGWNHADNVLIEDPFKEATAGHYVDFHEHFFSVFERQISDKGRTPSRFWRKLATVVAGLRGDARPQPDAVYRYLASHVVVQDLIPFHSARDRVSLSDMAKQQLLKELATSALSGFRSSDVSGVLVFSPQGYEIMRPRLAGVRLSVITGGKARSVAVATGRLGDVPFLLVRNQLAVQPLIPYDEVLPQLRSLIEFPI